MERIVCITESKKKNLLIARRLELGYIVFVFSLLFFTENVGKRVLFMTAVEKCIFINMRESLLTWLS